MNIMEAIWEMSLKEEDGAVHYNEEFVDFLWEFGFVDTDKTSLQQWREVFVSFRQKDGFFKLDREAFLSLEPYRYNGPIKIPFDPMQINEGKYTDEGFDKLAENAIAPSNSLSKENYQKFIADLKNSFRQSDQLILIKSPAKQKIKKLLEEHPSPLRRLELLFRKLVEQQSLREKADHVASKVTRVASHAEQQKLQTSMFTTAPSFAEANRNKLKNLTKEKEPETKPDPIDGGQKLKNIKRSRKGLRG